MTDEAAEKQYDPSSKRLDDLKRKGQVLRSRDLSGGLLILVSVITLSGLSQLFQIQLKSNFLESFNGISHILSQQDHFFPIIRKLFIDNFILIIPVLLVALLSVLFSVFIFGGWNFTLQAVSMDFSKMNPSTNLGNIFSKRTLVEIAKSIIKFSLVFGFVLYFFTSHIHDLSTLSTYNVKSAIFNCYYLVFSFIWSLLISLVFIVGADMSHQYIEYIKRNKMSFQEVRDEQKETDGSPESKRRQKSAQFALLKQRLTVMVPKADVIITNPTHYAVALRYVDGKDKAPRIVAKGKDYQAMQIRTIAISHGITIYPSPPLARAIYHTTKIGSTIHPDLYFAVAVVLSYVHQLKNFQYGKGALPEISTDLSIPDRFIFND